MATGNTSGIAGLQATLWEKELYKDVMDNLYFAKKGLMGEGANNIVQIKNDLKKAKGSTITFGISPKLGKASGVSGDNELEGRESQKTQYAETVVIDQFRAGVRLKGKLNEQKTSFSLRQDAKDSIATRMIEFVELQVFYKMAGVTNTSITDVAGTALATLEDGSNALTWSNTPNTVAASDSNAGYGDRYLCADYANGATSLAATDTLTPEVIMRAKVKAMNASPKVRPLRIDGQNMYLMFVHPWQAFDLKNDPTFAQARREADVRGAKNPIFTGALGVWDGVILVEHEYVPYLDVSVAGNNFAAAASGTDFSVDTFRAIFCGAQAVSFAKGNADGEGWVEETFDYKNKVGFSSSLIGGIQKNTFNSKDYGVILVDTAATALV